ncbi:hypothetical protein EDB19DRAFT_1829136 [Suillus lakei]|nr:hypothetical protein EDB19DRAFT_1829136 [Suillus lakei]
MQKVKSEVKLSSASDIIGALQNVLRSQVTLDAILYDISNLKTVMGGVETLHQQLIEQKDKITQSMNLHKRLGSALWRLPTEVLSHIFIYYVPQANYLSRWPRSVDSPVVLTKICRRWREVAMGMPNLWCRLAIHSNWQERAFCYESWLKCSQGRPLSLELVLPLADGWDKLQNLLQPYINQIMSLSVIIVHGRNNYGLMFTDFLAREGIRQLTQK